MKTNASIILAVVGHFIIAASPTFGHPGSGIIADEHGNVYISVIGEWAAGLWCIDSSGQTKRLGTTGAHWIALDAQDKFARSDLEGWFGQRITPNLKRTPREGANGAVLQTDGSPMVMNRDGSLYYIKGLELARLTPDGKVTMVVTQAFKETVDRLGGIKGLARDEAGTIYAACPSAILKLKPEGTFTTMLHPVTVKDCDSDPPPNSPAEYAPHLTGLTVGPKGVIYAAATGCRRLLRISPQGQVDVVLKAEAPWSPTGVALHGDDIFILENTNANADTHEWQHRVRKLTHDGKITTVLTIPRDAR
jgi:sugar lactone lactonase YvrE